MIFLGTLILSVMITIAMVPVCREIAIMFYVLDIPNERGVHTQPIPRIGGVAMVLGAYAPLLLWNHSSGFVPAYLAGVAILAVFGIIDDFRGLSPRAKFTGQIIAALIVVKFGGISINSLGTLIPDGQLLPGWFSLVLSVIAIVGVTNAINLSDGLDGLAGGISLLIFSCIGYLAYLDGNTLVAFISLALAGGIFGFLRFNTHPASIFMGDTGSQFLGFSAVTLSLALTQRETALSPLLPLILLGFPVLDTLTVMTRRIVHGRSPFVADKNHFHHTLLALGFRHPESVLIIYVIQTFLVVAALSFRHSSDRLLLGGYCLFSITVLSAFALARRLAWRLKRFELLDGIIAGKYQQLKAEGTVVKKIFSLFEYGALGFLLATCVLPEPVPGYVAIGAPACALTIVAVGIFKRQWLNLALRPILYLLIPFAVYLSDAAMQNGMAEGFQQIHNGFVAVLAVLIVVVSRFSRRQEGFRSTTLDFLILMIAAVLPNLPMLALHDYRLGMVAAKILLLYYCFEVLMAELRGKLDRVAIVTVLSLILLATR